MKREDVNYIKQKARWKYAQNLAKNVIKDLDELKKFLEWFVTLEEIVDMKEEPGLAMDAVFKIVKHMTEIYRLVG